MADIKQAAQWLIDGDAEFCRRKGRNVSIWHDGEGLLNFSDFLGMYDLTADDWEIMAEAGVVDLGVEMTDEEKVKAKWPRAYCRFLLIEGRFLGYQICDPDSRVQGYYFAPRSTLQITETEAWADAAKRLENERLSAPVSDDEIEDASPYNGNSERDDAWMSGARWYRSIIAARAKEKQ